MLPTEENVMRIKKLKKIGDDRKFKKKTVNDNPQVGHLWIKTNRKRQKKIK